MKVAPTTARIDGDALTLGFVCEPSGAIALAYLGPRLPLDEDLLAIAAAARFGRHEAQPDEPVGFGLLPQSGTGFLGTPALALRRGDIAIVTAFECDASEAHETAVRFLFVDRHNDLSLTLDWRIATGDVVVASATLTNTGTQPVAVDDLVSLALPLPDWATTQTRFAGRWSGEMRLASSPIAQGATIDQSRGGKPGFGGGGWRLVGEAGADADRGRMIGAHLAWSGDVRSLIEGDGDGAAQLQMGCRLDTGEVVLAPGQNFTTPNACFAFSDKGRNGLRRAFHAYLRADVLPPMGPRKVHINSWDALHFDLDEARLMRFADGAAALGIERFMLDDGWFAGRADDRTSLGDWTPDPVRFPNGLAPLIAHVAARGMDFGLWVEPEMVNADSDLYRAHPDWCLHLPGRARPQQRQQLVLDLTRAEVTDYLFGVLDRLLGGHVIAYLKWDHNRDLFPVVKGHAQTLALYALLDRLRIAHPAVEIETCSSGGGRVDFALLERCHRFWPSDNNDPVERLRINAAWSLFLPPGVMGTHVGPAINPVTGRTTPMDFRAKVALFGHMGVEADPAGMTDTERATLAATIALYKKWRALLHGGEQEEIAFDDPALWGTIVRGGDSALALVARTDFAPAFNAQRVRLTRFDAGTLYRVRLLDPWPDKARHYLHDADAWRNGHILSGLALAETGLAIPLAHPDTAWLIAIEKVR